jgi:hypothetical protein
VPWPINNNIANDSMIPKMEPMIPKEYEAFFDIRPRKVPVANEASVAMTSGSVKRSKIAYFTFFEMLYFRLLSSFPTVSNKPSRI